MAKDICPTAGFERLLVATDGSPFSENAVREAFRIAKACKGKIYLLSVVEMNPEFEAVAPKTVEKAERKTRKYLEAVKSTASKEGIECETVVHQGDEPWQFIVHEASRNKAGTIVMGSHGRTGLKRLMMGSTASRVVGHAPCNVLIVPVKKKK